MEHGPLNSDSMVLTNIPTIVAIAALKSCPGCLITTFDFAFVQHHSLPPSYFNALMMGHQTLAAIAFYCVASAAVL